VSSSQQNQTPVLSVVKDGAAKAQASDATESSDRTLDWSICMARAQTGDRQAYRRLLEEIAPYIRSIAVRYVQDRSDIEDAVQDVLLTVHAIRNTYDPMRPFGPWLVAIARRRIIDGLRRRSRAAAREVPLDPDDETFAAPESNFHEAASEGRALREALRELPAGQREAIRMVKLEEMSLKEAAAASGTSVAALKVATHRGLKNLRRLLGKKDAST
jgi:RNA polymerase sigma factor (sigma-70 family)